MKQSVLELLDLDRNGLKSLVNRHIETYRKGAVRLKFQSKDGPVSGAKVTIEQTGHEFKFGCNAFMADGYDTPEKNEIYRRIFRENFNQAVVPFYWNADEPEEGKWRLEADASYIYRRPAAPRVLDFCRDVGAEPKGHNMLWFQMPPEWLVYQDVRALEKHISERFRRLSRFADDIPVWDVVNEHLSRMLVFEQPEKWAGHCLILPKDYVYRAFELAARYFPDNHLIANEDTERTWDDFHYDSSKFYLYLSNLIARGYRVDGMGMQYHLFTREEELEEKRKATTLSAEHLLAFQDFYSQMNRPMHVSEITLPSYGGGAENEEIQARMADNLYRIWFSGPMSRSIVWWNLSDGAASGGEDYYSGGLLRADLTPKPSMKAVSRLINHEWHSHAVEISDELGGVNACLFYGDYRVTLEKNGQTAQRSIFFGKNSAPVITLEI